MVVSNIVIAVFFAKSTLKSMPATLLTFIKKKHPITFPYSIFYVWISLCQLNIRFFKSDLAGSLRSTHTICHWWRYQDETRGGLSMCFVCWSIWLPEAWLLQTRQTKDLVWKELPAAKQNPPLVLGFPT